MAQDRPVETAFFEDDGRVPNSRLPVIIYRQAVDARTPDMAVAIEQRFGANRWTNGWRSGIYTFHHYHSTSHEVLGIARGKVALRLGGETAISSSAPAMPWFFRPAPAISAYPNAATFLLSGPNRTGATGI